MLNLFRAKKTFEATVTMSNNFTVASKRVQVKAINQEHAEEKIKRMCSSEYFNITITF